MSEPQATTRPPTDRARFLDEAKCRDIAARLATFARGGGSTSVVIRSAWIANVRWARNLISTTGEVRQNDIAVGRNIAGVNYSRIYGNDTSDTALMAAMRRAERLTLMNREWGRGDLLGQMPMESSSAPALFDDATFNMDAEQRTTVAQHLAQSAAAAGMLSAGYIQVSAHSSAILDTFDRVRYFQWTAAQYTVTVRDPSGTGSGWAGVDADAWRKIDGEKVSQIALDKCLASRNPSTLEPGRYTTILEPQAVCDFIGRLVGPNTTPLDRVMNEWQPAQPFYKSKGVSRIGERVADERVTISSDPMDPELGFPPWQSNADPSGDAQNTIGVFYPVTWIKNGVLANLSYDRSFGLSTLGKNTGLPNSGSFRMSGGTTSIDEMIATTKRGLVVTRFSQVQELDSRSQLYRGYTRDGLWLVENGKITRPAKNFAFTESILFVLNKIEQLGVPQRVFNTMEYWAWPPMPAIVPALKISDFSFTSLADAV